MFLVGQRVLVEGDPTHDREQHRRLFKGKVVSVSQSVSFGIEIYVRCFQRLLTRFVHGKSVEEWALFNETLVVKVPQIKEILQ